MKPRCLIFLAMLVAPEILASAELSISPAQKRDVAWYLHRLKIKIQSYRTAGNDMWKSQAWRCPLIYKPGNCGIWWRERSFNRRCSLTALCPWCDRCSCNWSV